MSLVEFQEPLVLVSTVNSASHIIEALVGYLWKMQAEGERQKGKEQERGKFSLKPGLAWSSVCLSLPHHSAAEAVSFYPVLGLWSESSCWPCGRKPLHALLFGSVAPSRCELCADSHEQPCTVPLQERKPCKPEES